MTVPEVLTELRTRVSDPYWSAPLTRDLVLDVTGGDKVLAIEVIDLLAAAQEAQFVEREADPNYVAELAVTFASHAHGLIDRVERAR